LVEVSFKRLEEIEVWQRGCRLAVDIYKITSIGQFEKDWGLRDQIRRAAVSIPSNIAEGFERDTDAEFSRFASIAKGSCAELRTQIYIALAIGYIDNSSANKLLNECIEIASMLKGLMKYLKQGKTHKK
jgi:four helix bundle protein